MTAIEQIAREYSEESSSLLMPFPDGSYVGLELSDEDDSLDIVKYNLQHAFIAGYTEALRWRDVKEELPDTDDSGSSDTVLIKLSVLGKQHEDRYGCCIEGFYDSDVKGWYFMLPVSNYTLKITPIAWRPIEITPYDE